MSCPLHPEPLPILADILGVRPRGSVGFDFTFREGIVRVAATAAAVGSGASSAAVGSGAASRVIVCCLLSIVIHIVIVAVIVCGFFPTRRKHRGSRVIVRRRFRVVVDEERVPRIVLRLPKKAYSDGAQIGEAQ